MQSDRPGSVCSLDRRLAHRSRGRFSFRIRCIAAAGCCYMIIGYRNGRVASGWPFARKSPSLRRMGRLIVAVLPLLLGLVKGQMVYTG